MDRGAWQATVHGVTKSWTQMSDFHFQSHLQTSPCPLQYLLEGDSILISVKAFSFNKMALEIEKTK